MTTFAAVFEAARGNGTSCPQSTQPSAPLIVATHQALLELDATGCFSLLSAGAGKYYGVAVSKALGLGDGALLVGSQSLGTRQPGGHSIRNASGLPGGDALLLMATPTVRSTRQLLGAWAMPTRYLHDSAIDDRGHLYATDAATGQLFELKLTSSLATGSSAMASASWLELRQELTLTVRRQRQIAATRAGEAREEHINGVAFDAHRLWVMHQ